MNFFLIFAFLFFIGSCLGWCMELFFRRFLSKNNPQRIWVNPGFLTGPYLPLYGFGVWGMYEISHVIKMLRTGNPAVDIAVLFLIMSASMTIIEYIAGIVFVRGMNVKLWDYSQERFNIQGLICPKFSVVWGVLGVVYFFTLNRYVEGWVEWLSGHLTFSFFVGMFFGVFAVDLSYTLHLSARIRKFAAEKEFVVKYEELKNFIKEQRVKREEKNRFVFAFKSEIPFAEQLEHYHEFHQQVHEELKKLRADKKRKKRGKC